MTVCGLLWSVEGSGYCRYCGLSLGCSYCGLWLLSVVDWGWLLWTVLGQGLWLLWTVCGGLTVDCGWLLCTICGTVDSVSVVTGYCGLYVDCSYCGLWFIKIKSGVLT